MACEISNILYKDVTLIDLVKKYAFIYNNSDYRFKDKLERRKAWRNIGAHLNITADECESRFQNFRNRFAKERSTILKIRESEHRKVDSDWPLYKTMTFLDPFVRTRKSKRKYSSAEADMLLQDPLLTSCELPVPPKTQFIFQMSGSSNSETAQSPINQTDHEYYTNTSEPATVDLPEPVHFPPEGNMKYEIESDNDTNQLMSRIQKVEESIQHERTKKAALTSTDDQFQSFGRTIAFMLTSIKNKRRQRKAMADLLKRISEYDTDSDSE